MTHDQLSTRIPLGPFAESPVKVWSAPGKAAKLHASAHCSRLRSGQLVVSELPLHHVVERWCPQCTTYGRWGRPGTGVGIFLDALSGMGLLYELDRYAGADEDTRSDDEVRQAAVLLKRAPRGEPEDGEPEDGDDAEDEWQAAQEARDVRTWVFEQWRGAAASLHRAQRLLAPFPWLRPWADSALQQKASYIALLQGQAKQLVSREALTAAACAGVMDTPQLPEEDPAFAALGTPTTVAPMLASLWRRWSGRASASWEHPREHAYLVRYLTNEMGSRRKGRDAVLEGGRRLVAAWTAAAETGSNGARGERTLLARLPEQNPEQPGGRDEKFLQNLSEWETGVLVSWGEDVDWERLTVTLEVPKPIAAGLMSSASALACSTLDDTGAAPTVAPELLVEPGVFDDGPIAKRQPVTPGHLRALRAVSQDVDQLYLVLSTAGGPEVMPLSLLEQRVAAGDRCIVVTAASDLPDELLPVQDPPVSQDDSAAGGSIWPPRVHDLEHPDFGRELGIAEGQQLVMRLGRRGRDTREVDFALRSLALANAVTDLRTLEGEFDQSDYRHNAFPRDMWHGLLAMEQLDLQPFKQVTDDRFHSGSGLPLAVLARVQLYTTDATGHYQGRAHSPACAHQRHDRGLTRHYDLTTVDEILRAKRFDPCSKCGGYATRRLTEAQVAYYRTAHQLHATATHVRWALESRSAAADTTAIAAEAQEWSSRRPADEWFEIKSQALQWHRTVDDLCQQARKLSGP